MSAANQAEHMRALCGMLSPCRRRPAPTPNVLSKVSSRAVGRAKSDGFEPDSAAPAEESASQLKDQLDTALPYALRRRNAATAGARISLEIWLHIWRHASFDDRVSIARVCYAWRTLAHATSELWTNVHVDSFLHHEDCECPECYWSNHAGDTNLGPASNALCSLSGEKGLRLSIYIDHDVTHWRVFENLGRCLKLCARRLVDFDITSGDEFLPTGLLDYGCSFLSLRRLRIFRANSNSMQSHFRSGDRYLSDYVGFPSLEVLESDMALFWGTFMDDLVRLPALKKLTCTFTDPEEIDGTLSACSEEVVLGLDFHWRLNSLQRKIFNLPPSTQSAIDSVPVVRISNLSAAQEEIALSVLGLRRRRLSHLSYLARTIALGLRACSNLDISSALELHCLLVNGNVELKVIDRHQSTGTSS